MIGRSPSKAGSLLAIGILTIGLAAAGFAAYTPSALAAPQSGRPATLVISLDSGGHLAQHATTAQTVGAFLASLGIVPGAADYVYPSLDTPLTSGLQVVYRAAVPVRIDTATKSFVVSSAAQSVGELLRERGIRLGKDDRVRPPLDAPFAAGSTVDVIRVLRWTTTEKHRIAQRVVHKIDFALAPGKTRVLSAGRPGLRVVVVRYTEHNFGKIHKRVLVSRVVRKPQPRVVAQGAGEFAAFEAYARQGSARASYIASSAMHMVATAYTADCYGCSGYTATGSRAGHGIVAVDPRVIPLGTKLYIPGYGVAVAGDTGGAILGDRIDLGFNSLPDALRFGRRVVTVYRLK